MAFYRAFSVGRFRCAEASPRIKVAEFPREGYALVIRKESARKFCLGCIRNFIANKSALRATETESYLTINSP